MYGIVHFSSGLFLRISQAPNESVSYAGPECSKSQRGAASIG
jgi:hypothetical protein